MKMILLLLAAVVLPGCASKPATWEWSQADGCKPGIGLRLVVNGDDIAGTFHVIDPNRPGDFSSGQIVPLDDLHRTGRTIAFAVTLRSGDGSQHDSEVLEVEHELTGAVGAEVRGTLRAADGSSPKAVVLVRRK